MRIVTFLLSALFIGLCPSAGMAVERLQTGQECVAYFLKIVPEGERVGRNIFHASNIYFEIVDVGANQVLDRNRTDHDGRLFFRFCLPDTTQKMAIRYRLGNPQSGAVDLPVEVSRETIRTTSAFAPQVIVFAPDELLDRRILDRPQGTKSRVAVPVRFSDCSGRTVRKPKGMLLVKDPSGSVIRKADALSDIVPLDCDKTSLLSFESADAGNAYQIKPQSITPLLLNQFAQEPFDIEVTQVPQKAITLKITGLVSGASPELILKDNRGLHQTFVVDPNQPLVHLTLKLQCDGTAHYNLSVVEDSTYQGNNYSFDLTANSREAYDVKLTCLPSQPPQYYFLINIAGSQMEESLDSVKASLKTDSLKKLTGNHARFFMAFEGTVRETDLKELYFDPSVREDLPKLLKNFAASLPIRTRKHLIYVTSSGRTIRYRTDLPEMAMTGSLSDQYNMTFSAVVIGDADSKELKDMTVLGKGIYRTVPIGSHRDMENIFSEIVSKLNLEEK